MRVRATYDTGQAADMLPCVVELVHLLGILRQASSKEN